MRIPPAPAKPSQSFKQPAQSFKQPEQAAQPGQAVQPVQAEKMGYTIQVGAFTRVDNAARLTKKLEKQGLEAFYFAHSSGLYKVRFGNYSSLRTAFAEAKHLRDEGVIDVYYVVKPGEYAVARGRTPGKGSIREEIVDTAETFIGIPYQWGGCSPDSALDCSGLVLAVYQLNGLNVPRTSEDQYRSGRQVMADELEKGDLVFFSTSSNGRVSHVGIYIGDDKFIHAPGRGKTICSEKLSTSYYRDRFYGACSYLR
ncbi:MAG: NlpC/P60 family protein [Syntrophaceae bacterium]|nr:NlpC/P60 family protein [Deltaproteobacteria bacterium]